MTVTYTSFEQLPLFLNAEELARLFNVSVSSAYALMRLKDFPTLCVGRRKAVPRDKLLEWVDKNIPH